MKILHIGWQEKKEQIIPFLWQESQKGPEGIDPNELGIETNLLSSDTTRIGKVHLKLISRKGRMISSLNFINQNIGRGRPGLKQFTINTLLLDPITLSSFILNLKRQNLPNSLILGPDLKFWTVFYQWCLGFLVREDIIPHITQTEHLLEAKWLPIFKEKTICDLVKWSNRLPPCIMLGIDQEYSSKNIITFLIRVSRILIDTLCKLALIKTNPYKLTSYDENIHDIWLKSLSCRSSILNKTNFLKNISIEKLTISRHIKNILTKNHILTSTDIINLGPDRLLQISGLDEQSLQETIYALKEQGIDLSNICNVTTQVPINIKKLKEEIIRWEQPLTETAQIPFRLSLTLLEPQDEQKDMWRLEANLQAIDDPNLYIPASLAWTEPDHPIFQTRTFENPRASLMALLGRATKIFQPIRYLLSKPGANTVILTTRDAYVFLKEKAWLLKENDFNVQVPVWWENRKNSKWLKVIATTDQYDLPSGLKMNSVLKFNWKIALGNSSITTEELKQLAKTEQGLLKIGNQWVEFNPQEAQKLIKKLTCQSSNQITLSQVIAAGLGIPVEHNGIEIQQVNLKGQLSKLIRELKSNKLKEISPPEGLNGTLRPYQIYGLSWLNFMGSWGLGACLADDMGLGKTIQILSLIQKYLEDGISGPFLVIAPTSVLGNWEREIQQFIPKVKSYLHHGPLRPLGKQLTDIISTNDITLTSYTLISRDYEELGNIYWTSIILDEAQNIKNPNSKQTRIIKSLRCKSKIALTGTPVENSLSDLWSIMDFLNPGILGSYQSFKKRYQIPIQLEHKEECIKELKKLSNAFILRREKTDPKIAPDLPEKIEYQIHVTLTPEQITLYQSVIKEAEQQLSGSKGIERKGIILSTITRLKQICNHPALFLKDHSKLANRSGKLDRIEEMLEEILTKDEAALIFTQFSSMGELLTLHLTKLFDIDISYIHGAVPRKKRDKIVQRFQKSSGAKILVLSLRASGTGLNLTRATHVFHYDRWWNPAVENQATDRAYRIGQTQNVQVHKFVCKGTIEERIEELINKKINLAETIITKGENWITTLSNEEIKRLLRLEL